MVVCVCVWWRLTQVILKVPTHGLSMVVDLELCDRTYLVWLTSLCLGRRCGTHLGEQMKARCLAVPITGTVWACSLTRSTTTDCTTIRTSL